ncbi:hypothetical protein [Desulfonema ishimotonii]|uniref:hypothetical protein n=1 Tax=Desulfonema ishimotonii TaxID=45657 RepID=UPI000F57C054|nr:hypothetical protein [Desulfonema ishimotonii]
MSNKTTEQILLPFPKRETFFSGRRPVQTRILFPFNPKKRRERISSQLFMFSDESEDQEAVHQTDEMTRQDK